MKMLMIQNEGEIDINALLLVGASTKEGDSTKIGFFGSGNKYALACLLRNSINFEIYSGFKKVEITTTPIDLRGETFDRIDIDGQPTSLTTRMGPQWVPWMALREFACNAIDEGGFELECMDDVEPVSGHTRIYVELRTEIQDFYDNRWKYLEISEPIYTSETDNGKVLFFKHKSGENKKVLYRKGVRCNPVDDNDLSLYRYDLQDLSISESRIYSSWWEVTSTLAKAYLQCEDEAIIRNFVKNCTRQNYIERNLSWNVGDSVSAAWKEVLKDSRIAPGRYVQFMPPEDTANCVVLQDSLVEVLKEHLPQLEYVGEPSHYTEVEATEHQHQTLLSAIEEVEAFGYPSKELTYKIVSFKTEATMAQYSNGTVYISVNHMANYDELVSTVLEEVSHHKGYSDGSRAFEQYLMRELVQAYRKAKRGEEALDAQAEYEQVKAGLKLIGGIFHG